MYVPFGVMIERPQMGHWYKKLDLLLEGVRCGLDKEITPDG
jgi:hypothetical protein